MFFIIFGDNEKSDEVLPTITSYLLLDEIENEIRNELEWQQTLNEKNRLSFGNVINSFMQKFFELIIFGIDLFTVLLLYYGISNKLPNYLKPYLIFGVRN